jgi:hypothetical protein
VQEVLAQITWYHHITLLEKVKDKEERVWYIQQAIEHGWSRNVLWHHIDTRLFHRRGKAVTNFPTTLPALTSDLATSLLKDPYVFDFITTSKDTFTNPRGFGLDFAVGRQLQGPEVPYLIMLTYSSLREVEHIPTITFRNRYHSPVFLL